MIALVVTGWQAVACFVSGLCVGIGGVTWWDANRDLERQADRENARRMAEFRRRQAALRPGKQVTHSSAPFDQERDQ